MTRPTRLHQVPRLPTAGLLLLLWQSISTMSPVQAFSNGAGNCPPGGPAVGGPHLDNPTEQPFDQLYTFTVADMDGTAVTSLVRGESYTMTVRATGTPFKGALVRLDGSGVLDAGSASLADQCEETGAMGLTHADSSPKTELAGVYTVGAESTLNVDVTVVESNNASDGSKFSHKGFTMTVGDAPGDGAAMPAAVPAPTAQSLSSPPVTAPVAAPVPAATAPPVAAPVMAPVMAAPVAAPAAAPVMAPVAVMDPVAAPAAVPVMAPVAVMEPVAAPAAVPVMAPVAVMEPVATPVAVPAPLTGRAPVPTIPIPFLPPDYWVNPPVAPPPGAGSGPPPPPPTDVLSGNSTESVVTSGPPPPPADEGFNNDTMTTEFIGTPPPAGFSGNNETMETFGSGTPPPSMEFNDTMTSSFEAGGSDSNGTTVVVDGVFGMNTTSTSPASIESAAGTVSWPGHGLMMLLSVTSLWSLVAL
jgi:hypothetical protein